MLPRLTCLLLMLVLGNCFIANAQTAAPAYGYDTLRGKYFEVAKDTKLYYEIYGEGQPVLLLHGGVYGYIDEFEFFIRELSKTNRVICLATRGHVKSDIGHEPFTYAQRASDAGMWFFIVTGQQSGAAYNLF